MARSAWIRVVSKTGRSRSSGSIGMQTSVQPRITPSTAAAPLGIDQIEVGGLGVRPDHALAELLVDHPMDQGTARRVGHRDVDAVTVAQPALVEVLRHRIAAPAAAGAARARPSIAAAVVSAMWISGRSTAAATSAAHAVHGVGADHDGLRARPCRTAQPRPCAPSLRSSPRRPAGPRSRRSRRTRAGAGRVQTAQALPRQLVQAAVVDGGALPAHPADQPQGRSSTMPQRSVQPRTKSAYDVQIRNKISGFKKLHFIFVIDGPGRPAPSPPSPPPAPQPRAPARHRRRRWRRVSALEGQLGTALRAAPPGPDALSAAASACWPVSSAWRPSWRASTPGTWAA